MANIRKKELFLIFQPECVAVCSFNDFKGNSEYSRGANLSEALINNRVIPNPELTAWMNIYVTAPVFHEINHPSRSASCLSCPTPPFLLFAVSYVPSYAPGTQNIRNFHLQVTACHRFMGGGERGDMVGGKMEGERVGIKQYSVKRCHFCLGVGIMPKHFSTVQRRNRINKHK